jgi:hypothetical protein
MERGLKRSESPRSIECNVYPAVLPLPFSTVRRKR